MSLITGIVMLAIGLAGFVAGYGLRSYLSLRRRRRARQSRFQVPDSERKFDPPSESDT